MKALAITIVLFILSCSDSPNIAGGSTSVENGFVLITATYEGKPISAEVKLIPSNYDPLSGGSIRSQFSDLSGNVRFDAVPKGDYSVLIVKDSVGVFESGISINDSANVTLGKMGSLKVKADQNTTARLIGSPFVGVYNPVDSTILFNNIPAGTYPELKLSGTASGSAESVDVLTGETVLIESVQPELSILNIPLNSKLNGQAILSVSIDLLGRAWIAAGAAGFWYHDSPNWQYMPLPDSLSWADTISKVRVCPNSVTGALGIVHLLETSRGPILFEDGAAIDRNSVDPVVKGNAITASAMSDSGTSACATDTAVWFHRFGKLWEKISFTGTRSLFCGTDTLWIGTKTGTVVALDMRTTDMSYYFAGSQAVDAVSLIKGKLYLGTSSGLYEKKGNSFELISGAPDSINQIVQDSSGVIWAISGKSSLMKYDGKTVQTFSPLNGSLDLREICGTGNGITAACGVQGVYRFW